MLIGALLIFVGEIGVPTGIPVELALLIIGSHSLHSPWALAGAVVGAAIADILGTMTLHLVARTGGSRLLNRFMSRHEIRVNGGIDRWRRRLGGHDAPVVFVLRLLPVVRMWAAVCTGLLRIRVRNYVMGAAPAALIWSGAPLVVGYFFRADVQALEARYTALSRLLLIGAPLIFLIAAFATWMSLGAGATIRLRRLRLGLGSAAQVGSAVYLVKATWRVSWAIDRERLSLPLPLLALSLVGLAIITVALFAIASDDLRAERAAAQVRLGTQPGAPAPSMLLWLGLLSMAAVITVLIEAHAPML